jgi:hypothetical protein|tara:strand:- start:1097 stop:2134 length:1038 start_codon:yes stop_codon:yes gene_type:complete
MSEVQEDFLETSSEDKFFGVKHTVGTPVDAPVESESESDDFELEIIDDRPEEDRRPPRAKVESEETDDEELSGYSERVQKRINKLRYEQNEERRQREAAERMREEAVAVAQTLAAKNKEYESLISRGESALVGQIKQKAQIALESAKSSYKKAYEEGDSESVVSANERLMMAQAELKEAERHEANIAQQAQAREQQYQQQPQQYQQPEQYQQQPVPQPDPEAQRWAAENPWFMKEGYEEMTSLAYGTHTALVRRGVAPNSKEYFDTVDATMRQRFPDYDWGDSSDTDGRSAAVNPNQPSSVVAPSSRSNGAKPRKIQLTPSQVALAKRIGLTNEQYARQLLKERG